MNTQRFIITLLLVSAVSAGLGFINGEWHTTKNQLAAADASVLSSSTTNTATAEDGCTDPNVKCTYSPKPTPKPVGLCVKPPTPEIKEKCDEQKQIGEKQVTSGIGEKKENIQPPTISKVEYSPSECRVATAVGSGQCNPKATKKCPTALTAGTGDGKKKSCFWTQPDCKKACSSTPDDEKKQPDDGDKKANLTPDQQPQEQPTDGQGGEQPEMPQMPQGGGGGGGGEEPPKEEEPEQQQARCVLDPVAAGCPNDPNAQTAVSDPEEENGLDEFADLIDEEIEPGGNEDVGEEVAGVGDENPADAATAQNPGDVVPVAHTSVQDADQEGTPFAVPTEQPALFSGIGNYLNQFNPLATAKPAPTPTALDAQPPTGVVGNPVTQATQNTGPSAVNTFATNVITGGQALVNTIKGFFGF